MTNDMVVARTILEQLGGRKFLAMTGAKQLVGGDAMLTFRLPARFARHGINLVRVRLDSSDTYTVTFWKSGARALDLRMVVEFTGIYGDGLRELFTRTTGLETSLGTMGAVR